MIYCQRCGHELDGHEKFCPSCGKSTPNNAYSPSTSSRDEGGFGWSLLGFCVPIVGLVLYLVWKDERPNTARDSIRGFIAYLIFLGIGIVVYIIFIIGILGAANYPYGP